ncbi:FAD dependent oxidoreductase TIGR03364 [Brevibacterium pityocampae]
MNKTTRNETSHSDITVIGAGIIGLAHAFLAHRRGLSVTIVEARTGVTGASVRNFGHFCMTGQTGAFFDRARAGREHWLAAASAAGFWAEESGAYALARTPAELAVLEQASTEDEELVRLVDAESIRRAVGARAPVIGGALLPADMRVDPREAAPRLLEWLRGQSGVTVLEATRALAVAPGRVRTTRGDITTGHVFVCTGHELGGILPAPADAAGLRECSLQMARVRLPEGYRTSAAVLTGTSLLRYDRFAAQPAAAELREEIAATRPELFEIVANVMCAPLPDGTLLVGDSHDYAATAAPFLREETSRILLTGVAEALGTPALEVLERWQGVYASSTTRPLIVEDVEDGVTAVTVATGLGMTLGFGLAAEQLDRL